jgi:tetratricopeptide (TPR) repeat protein
LRSDERGVISIDLELARIRELTRMQRHGEALGAAVALAVDAPGHRDVLFLIAANQRCLNRTGEALATLERLEQQHPRFSRLYQERGHCYLASRDASRAIAAFQRAVSLNHALPTSWMLLERLHRMMGDPQSAATAAEQLLTLKLLPPEVVQAGSLFSDGDLTAADNTLRDYLDGGGYHVEALRLLARIKHQQEMLDEAERLLENVLKLDPNYRAARLDYIRVLIDRQKYLRAREETDGLLLVTPDDVECLSLRAGACAGLGDHESAIALYRALPATEARYLLPLAHSLRTIGRQREAIEFYQAATSARPGLGDAYWSLANLKTYCFSQDEIERMLAEEAAPGVQPVDHYHLCFALGKALENRGEFGQAWQYYERGNALKRARSLYRPEFAEINTEQQIAVCTAEFLTARAGVGAPDPDPIFIVGLPRSGSTLIEQILASHSRVEGTHELADIPRMAQELPGYPGILTSLAPGEFRKLGERYMHDTRAHRRPLPHFIDKMPNNFRHIGLIHLMLPNATIIDARREPMACCFSNLKQLFASGQDFSYSVEDIARYYRAYLELMRHWDAVLPGRVLRVLHEDVVEDLEHNVRRILDFCGLEFEPACLEFYKTARTIRTASSEQVRQPLFRDGLTQWRNYAAWLSPLQDALGDALTRYRD